jgi:MFS family permease
VSFGMGIGVIILILLAAGLIAILYGVTKSVLVVGVLGFVIGIGSYVAFIYVSSWTALATISVLTREEKLGVGATFEKVRPMVWGYFWMSFLAGLFMIGLMPWGILSFGVVFILWALWSSFLPFVYLKFQKKGLQSLWISRQMFRQNPWGIFGRLFLINFAVFAVSFLISLSGGSGKNNITSGFSILFSAVTAPLALSFSYEMFLNLEYPKEEVKTPTVWVVFSVLGFVLTILLVVLGVYLTYSRIFTNFGMKDLQNLQNLNQTEMQKQLQNLKPEEQEFLNKMKEITPGAGGYGFPTSVPTVGSSSGTMGY